MPRLIAVPSMMSVFYVINEELEKLLLGKEFPRWLSVDLAMTQNRNLNHNNRVTVGASSPITFIMLVISSSIVLCPPLRVDVAVSLFTLSSMYVCICLYVCEQFYHFELWYNIIHHNQYYILLWLWWVLSWLCKNPIVDDWIQILHESAIQHNILR